MKNTISYIFLPLLTLFIFSGCKKDVQPIVPGDGNEGYVNFVNASEAILQQYNGGKTLSVSNMVFINDSVAHTPFQHYPQFRDNILSTSEIRQFPADVVSADVKSYIPDPIREYSYPYGLTFWMPIASAQYRFIFTSLNRYYLKDTTVNVQPKVSTTYYLVESPASPDAYRIVDIPAIGPGSPGKMRLQLVNLSPDLLSGINFEQTDKSGRAGTALLPKDLAFGAHAEVEIDTASASGNFNQVFLRIKQHNTGQTLFTASIPAVPESSFFVVIQGFTQQTTRRVRISNTEFATIPVYANLRVTLRRIY